MIVVAYSFGDAVSSPVEGSCGLGVAFGDTGDGWFLKRYCHTLSAVESGRILYLIQRGFLYDLVVPSLWVITASSAQVVLSGKYREAV